MARSANRHALPVALAVCVCAVAAGCAGPGDAGGPAPPAPPPHPHKDLSAETVPLSYVVYHVQPGDTLYSLAQRFHVPWEEIAESSNIERPEQMSVGMPLLIRVVPGVQVPATRPIARAQPRTERRSVPPADLHRGKPNATYWWPTKGAVSRAYGAWLNGLPEPGIGISAAPGTDVCSVAAGTVAASVRAEPGKTTWGNVVAVSHAGGIVSWYAGLDRILVEKGAAVSRGQPIGTLGRGQLAFRMFKDERPVNPMGYLP